MVNLITKLPLIAIILIVYNKLSKIAYFVAIIEEISILTEELTHKAI